MIKIVNAVSAATSGAVETTTIQLDGGPRTAVAYATTWNGANAVFKASVDNGATWYPLLDGEEQVNISQNGVIALPHLPSGVMLGACVTGTPTALTVEVL